MPSTETATIAGPLSRPKRRVSVRIPRANARAQASAPGADATPHRDSRAAAPMTSGLDPRVELLLQECFRHAKAIGGWGAGADTLSEMFGEQPGIVIGGEPADVVESLLGLMAQHRAWDRFPASPAVLADPA